MRSKVFVSSVISGMSVWRDATREGIASLDHLPVMAEDFPASPATPRGACLAGVARADIVVVLLGRRYGERQVSGHSATDEEVREAKRLGLPILVFLTSPEMEEDQEEFRSRISEWQGGTTFKMCTSPSELQREVVRALRQLENAPAEENAVGTAERNLRRVLPEQRQGVVHARGPWLGFSWAPATAFPSPDEDTFFKSLADAIGDLLVAGPTRMLESRPDFRDEADGLVIRSRSFGREEPGLLGWVGIDGTVAIGSEIQKQAGLPFGDSMYVRPERARERLDRVIAAMGAMVDRLDPSKALQSGFSQAALACLGMAHFGDPPASSTRGIAVNLSGDEVLVVPDRPERVSRFDLKAGSPISRKYIDRFARSFERRRS